LNWDRTPLYNYNIRFLFDYPANYARLSFLTPVLLWSDSLYVSTISDRFTIYASELYHDLGAGNKIYLAQYEPLRGVNENFRLLNEPTDYVQQNLKITIPEKCPRVLNPGIELMLAWHSGDETLSAPDRGWAGLVAGRLLFGEGSWSGRLYHTPDKHEFRGATTVFQGLVDTTLAAHAEPYIRTEIFRVVNNQLGSFVDHAPSPNIYLSSSGGTMRFGDTPIYPLVQYDDLNGSEIAIWPQFFGSLGELRFNDYLLTEYALFDEVRDTLVAQGRFVDPNGRVRTRFVVSPAPRSRYRFEMTNSGYFVGDVRSSGKMTAHFDTRQQDATPPTITSFKLLNSRGEPVGHLAHREPAAVEFSGADYAYTRAYNQIAPDSTRLYIREWGTESWIPQELEITLHDQTGPGHRPIGYYYRGQLTGLFDLDSAAVDIKIHLRDRNGNSSDWVLSPAFSIGDFSANDDPSETPLPLEFTLHANYPNPFNPTTTIRYDLPQRTRVTLRIYNILGQSVKTLVDAIEDGGWKAVSWDGTNQHGNPVASGVYIYSLETPSFHRALKLLLIR